MTKIAEPDNNQLSLNDITTLEDLKHSSNSTPSRPRIIALKSVDTEAMDALSIPSFDQEFMKIPDEDIKPFNKLLEQLSRHPDTGIKIVLEDITKN